MSPNRPALRYHGGKWRIAPWIIDHFPPHEVYVEPFGGGASVLLRKKPARIEVYNDANEDVVEFFRILRDPEQAQRLRYALELTPFSRAEYHLSWEPSTDSLERARRLAVRLFQSYGAKGNRERNGWRTRTSKAVWSPCLAWNGWPHQIPMFVERMRGVIIECLDWRKVLDIYDAPGVLWYFDPPYPLGTRASGHRRTYGDFEMSDDDHAELCRRVTGLKGFVLISTYKNAIYDELLDGWTLDSISARAQCNSKRTEALYISPRTVEATMPSLFNGDAA